VDRRAERWVATSTGASSVRSVRSLTFGISSSLALVDADDRLLVLRSYDGKRARADEPEVENEVRALAAARGVLGGLVPEVVAADPVGEDAGCPSLLMTYLPGHPVVDQVDVVQLAAILAQLHAAPVPAELPDATPWFDPRRLAVPPWTEQPESWEQLFAMLEDPAPSVSPAATVFLHRDYHHGNVLWADGRISGVVDWPCACTGPRAADIAHTRGNLALVNGVEVADRFLAAYAARVPGYHQDPWWDAGALVGHVQENFVGIFAFRAFGAELEEELFARRADRFARALVGGA
jgi:aminoglycoside phosphotransferase (APT) family kinase protein